ncbi:MAG: PDZ domain-containing protein, partial [Verrucomicrobia bacterium]|nr:PDZ domain-containing protein [Verrucomicrobiota bacterium]
MASRDRFGIAPTTFQRPVRAVKRWSMSPLNVGGASAPRLFPQTTLLLVGALRPLPHSQRALGPGTGPKWRELPSSRLCHICDKVSSGRQMVAGSWVALVFLALAAASHSAGQASSAMSDLSEFRTVTTAIKTQATNIVQEAAGQPGHLGVRVEPGRSGKLVVQEIETDSPAAQAGLQTGDALTRLNGRPIRAASQLRDWLQAAAPGTQVRLTVERRSRSLELTATLGAVSRPLKVSEPRPFIGLSVGEPKEGGDGALIATVQPSSPAAKAGLRTNDVIVRICDYPLTTPTSLFDALTERKPGEKVTLAVRRNGQRLQFEATLGRARATTDAAVSGTAQLWKKDVYRLAVLLVEFPDLKFSPAITRKDWAESLFSSGTYQNKTNPTGQLVFGSVNDYYREMSCGAFRFEGRVFDRIAVGKKREDYAPGNTAAGKAVLLNEVIDKLLARDGKDALKDADGLLFIYAGERYPTLDRGSLYW